MNPSRHAGLGDTLLADRRREPLTMDTGTEPLDPNQNEFFDFNAWAEFAFTHPLRFPPVTAWSTADSVNNDNNNASYHGSMHAGHRNPELDLSLAGLSAKSPSQRFVPRIELANMVGSFLASQSRPHPEYLKLHPISVDDVQEFVFPGEFNSSQNDAASHGNPGLPVVASSSRTIFVGHQGDFKEVVVDLNLTAKARQVSSTRGRKGQLSEEQRAAMKLLKCDTKDFCGGCPQERQTPWRAVGCRRGTLRDALPLPVLCPVADDEALSDSPDLDGITSNSERSSAGARLVNDCSLEGIRRRNEILAHLASPVTNVDPQIDHHIFKEAHRSVSSRFHVACVPDNSNPESTQSEIAQLRRLHETVIAILWEFQHMSSSQISSQTPSIFKDIKLPDFANLLCSAALYQGENKDYHLIEISLRCLQSALEALRVQSLCPITSATHQNCTPSSCQVECLSTLDANLTSFLDLLSEVIFKKNSNYCRDWWLSVFYSLCIQSYVRKLLVALVSHLDFPGSREQRAATSQYLQVPVELFAAYNNSGKKYDPLSYNLDMLFTSEDNLLRKHSLTTEHAKVAQAAVYQKLWEQENIDGSYEYLRKQFEGDGEAHDITISPSPKRRDIETSGCSSPMSVRSGMSYGRFHGRRKRARFGSFSAMSRSSDDANVDLNNPHVEVPPPETDLDHLADVQRFRQNEVRFEGDLFTPHWLRGFKQEGWCGLCRPGRWLKLGEAWWNDRVLYHGICAETGKGFPEPEEAVELEANSSVEGYYSAWFIHSANCYDKNFQPILLKGLVCHIGIASIAREEPFIKDLIAVLNLPTAGNSEKIKKTIRRLFAGCVGITDCPAILLSEELAEVFPDSIVICTTRDPERWWESMSEVVKTVLSPWLSVLFYSMPILRYFGRWIEGIKHRYAVIYGDGKEYEFGLNHLQVHEAYLRRVIPPARLHFFNVKGGWEPLAKF
ncbi:hypothetical protein G7Y89_g1614 [Cudoniella acicularis]|uniref:Uncharacterized protein n=1 Tax=Cudoniella acicularis TaxID=354080 RepID=A0A8H4W784_9HELO|nr:hypothetical protein G7Y89_g1614 [Cudoniella acicularis]